MEAARRDERRMLLDYARRGLDRLAAPKAAWFRPRAIEPRAGVGLEYLGTAGFVVRGHGRTLVLDPYVSRPGVTTSLTRPLVSDGALVARLLPYADDVLIGHAHHDHILDAPALCRRTGARLIGSRAACMVGRAAGLPESQLRETAGREALASGAFTVRGLPSRHGKAIFGRVPLPGDLTEPPPWPPRITDLRHGLVLNWHIEVGGFSIVHVDSADFIDEELAGLRADVLCLCAVGRHYRPDYVKTIVSALRPRWVVPCHWDTMLTPIEATPHLIPGVDLPGMFEEIRQAGSMALPMPILGRVRF
jgi:L-ascorbate metabolism protein UlaG (beta-lactamase superfamily)